jgi:glycosyltransferase involved in cell wall biosynthesis
MIAYVCGSGSWGGLEMNQWRNAVWMKQRGHAVVVLGLEGSPLHLACKEDAIPFTAISPHKKHYDFGASLRLRDIIRKRNITQLIIRDGRDVGLATLTKTFCFGKLKVHYFMEMQLGVVKKNPAQTLRFRQLDSWICPLEWLVAEVKNNTFMPQSRIRHIPVGIELDVFRSEMTPIEARRLLGLPAEGIILGLAGRIDEQKGQVLLLQALKLLRARSTPVKVALLGSPTLNEDQTYYNELLDFIEKEQLSDDVHCLPFRKDHHVFYKAINVLIMPSLAETCGMVTIEAMASGIPVIGSNAGGTPELLRNGETGYLFESMNPVALSDQIELFLEDPQRFPREKTEDSARQFDHRKVCGMVSVLLGLPEETI